MVAGPSAGSGAETGENLGKMGLEGAACQNLAGAEVAGLLESLTGDVRAEGEDVPGAEFSRGGQNGRGLLGLDIDDQAAGGGFGHPLVERFRTADRPGLEAEIVGQASDAGGPEQV